jgi:hypothetical protein
MAFWSGTVKQDEPLVEQVPVNGVLIITNIALAEEAPGSTTLNVEVDSKTSLTVAHLNWEHRPQYSTTLHFLPGSDVTFKVQGKGKLNLIGFYESVEDYESDEEISDLGIFIFHLCKAILEI